MEIPIVLLVVAVVVAELSGVDSWSHDWTPNSVVKIQVRDRSTEIFAGRSDKSDHFRLLMADESSMLLGARNAVHNVSLAHLEENSRIDWEPQNSDIELCTKKQKSKEQCQNYIRVIVKIKDNKLFTCGTNAFRPRCREYRHEGISGYRQVLEQDGVGKCPFDPEQNSTSLYVDGNLYSATVADFNARDALIIDNQMIRTEQYDSQSLNEPNFVSSFEKDDKIMFFFRETAVEHTNCGKTVFSRVARVCKKDEGGHWLRDKIWTSFFKARLNCSIPGDFPFYFDEIQSTSDFGEGNFRPVSSSSQRSDMVYAVFNTPQNSIRGSAVCAFSYADIAKTFEGRFKGQESALHNWLAVPKEKYPVPHPQKCANRSQPVDDTTFNFIKTHPLMDSSVPALGGTPLLIQTSFEYRFTQIAIDWQIVGVGNIFYDIMFVGTDTGRVIKAVNTQKNAKAPVKTVVIEDIQVLKPNEAIINLKIYRREGLEKLIVISNDNVVSIPLHRCNQQRTCSGCVALQDPYCAWQEGRCSNAARGTQNIASGKSSACTDKIIEDLTSTTTTQAAMPEKCICPTATGTPKSTSEEPGITDDRAGPKPLPTRRPPISKTTWDYEEAGYGHSREELNTVATAETLAIAVVVSIVLSMLVGFLIGYKVSACRASRDIDPPYQERNIHLSKRSNRLSSGDHTYFNPDSPYKNFSYVVNVKTPGKLNTSVETKPVTKSNKVYL